jgi:hypothetical protein
VTLIDSIRGVKRYVGTDRREKSPDLGNVRSRRPKEHLIPILVQNPQTIGVLRHVQSAYIEERPGFHLCAFQIRRDVRNAGERGVRVVLFANAEELNRKHHLTCLSIREKMNCGLIHNANDKAATQDGLTVQATTIDRA